MKEKNKYNIVSISFASEVDVFKKAKERCQELGIKSFSEYVKQLIKLDLGLPNYIEAYMSKSRSQRAEELLESSKIKNKKP